MNRIWIIPTGDEIRNGVVRDLDSPMVMSEMLRIWPMAEIVRTAPVYDEMQEILNMLPPLKIIGAKTVSITKDKPSPLAQQTDIAILVDAGKEVDHMGLAPTSSSTAALAAGDALATVVSEIKEFRRENFALSHPGGALGQQLIREYHEKIGK